MKLITPGQIFVINGTVVFEGWEFAYEDGEPDMTEYEQAKQFCKWHHEKLMELIKEIFETVEVQKPKEPEKALMFMPTDPNKKH